MNYSIYPDRAWVFTNKNNNPLNLLPVVHVSVKEKCMWGTHVHVI